MEILIAYVIASYVAHVVLWAVGTRFTEDPTENEIWMFWCLFWWAPISCWISLVACVGTIATYYNVYPDDIGGLLYYPFKKLGGWILGIKDVQEG